MASVNTHRDANPAAAAPDGAVAPDYAVLTPERVTLQYDVAGIGSRSAAAIIDVTIQFGVLLVLLILTLAAGRLLGVTENLAGLGRRGGAAAGPFLAIAAVMVVVVFVVLFGYYMFFEIVWNGQTPGKRALGLRVLRENGYPARGGDAVVRNLVRVIDGPPFGAVVGLTVMLFNSRARRLGDFAAGTLVVREGARRSLAGLAAPAPAADPAAQTGVSAPRLSAADATLVRDFLLRRTQLAPEARSQLAGRLAQTLARRYGLQPALDATTAERFLESLVGR